MIIFLNLKKIFQRQKREKLQLGLQMRKGDKKADCKASYFNKRVANTYHEVFVRFDKVARVKHSPIPAPLLGVVQTQTQPPAPVRVQPPTPSKCPVSVPAPVPPQPPVSHLIHKCFERSDSFEALKAVKKEIVTGYLEKTMNEVFKAHKTDTDIKTDDEDVDILKSTKI